jgi:histidyl-tRNA synthetase
VLDSKDKGDIELLNEAPIILDFLDADSLNHFNFIRSILDSANINYEINNQLVRGLDYYSHTVFEFRSNLLGSQDSFGGGGRYDGLFSQLGGKETPAVGFAFGLERILLILEAANLLNIQPTIIDYFIVVQKPEFLIFANQICNLLRDKGFNVILELERRSFKAQMREANKANAKFVCIIGETEFESKTVTMKNLSNSEQVTIAYLDL